MFPPHRGMAATLHGEDQLEGGLQCKKEAEQGFFLGGGDVQEQRRSCSEAFTSRVRGTPGAIRLVAGRAHLPMVPFTVTGNCQKM